MGEKSPLRNHSALATLPLKSNPFATRFVAPGCVPWFGESPQELGTLARRFGDCLGRRGAIVGPHGTGKSTLLSHLVPSLGSVRYRSQPGKALICNLTEGDIIWLQLRRNAGAVAELHASRPHWASHRLLVIDGFEQLSWFRRLQVWWETRRRNMGILFTSHREFSLSPTLLETRVTLTLAKSIVTHLLETQGRTASKYPNDKELGLLLTKHAGNMRELMMELYDVFQSESKARLNRRMALN